jgi:hypothetical protein
MSSVVAGGIRKHGIVVTSVADSIEQISTQVPAKVAMHSIIPGIILNPSNNDPFRWRKDGRIALRRVGGIQVLADSICAKTSSHNINGISVRYDGYSSWFIFILYCFISFSKSSPTYKPISIESWDTALG